KRFIVLLWDHAPWHTSRAARCWVRAYNRRAKREGLTRLVLCYLPVRSPWRMPLEALLGWVKHQVLGPQLFDTLRALQDAVEQAFHDRVAAAQPRRVRYWAAETAQ
ncbi:MAG: transposase, partial [Anaerolineae bacterium]